MDATKIRTTGEVVLRIAAWLALAFVQIAVIGMSLSAWYPHGTGEESPVEARLWAVCLPVLFLASVATLLWRNPPEAVAAIGRIFLLMGGFLVMACTVGLLLNR